MDKLNEVLQKKDVSSIEFYLDYTEQLIDMYNKRGLCCKNLQKEKSLLEERIRELKNLRRL